MIKISTILRKAANEHLRLSAEPCNKAKYCCDAIDSAIFEMRSSSSLYSLEEDVRDFLTEMGQGVGLSEFKEFDYNQDVQQEVRYTWLMFAADIAEEEGD